MSGAAVSAAVVARAETIFIPTYPEPAAETLPMFAENRVHQRTSGRPYPNRIVSRVDRRGKVDREYVALRLENEHLLLYVLPQLGGRIFSATDKGTGYDFFYRQHVIKPALIGVLGSWISGGVEFNWPFHHRPSSFLPVDWSIEREADGGATVWLSEHDPMERMKGMVGIRLRPGEAVFETRVRLCNRTPVARSFLWWENAAVPVNGDYRIFFPPDVAYVQFHYRRSVTAYPVASGVYNGIRLGDGVDIRLHRNTRSPTSYFSAASRHDFFGGYDEGRRCGVVHVADRHVSSGKKMFTWAYNQLSRSWQRALTDDDGPYAELMAGAYSDNQPDFSWLEPYETKSFSQFWYPIGAVGIPVCANTNAALSLERNAGTLTVGLQSTRRYDNARLTVKAAGRPAFEAVLDLLPGKPVQRSVAAAGGECEVRVLDAAGGTILSYREEKPAPAEIPAPLSDLPVPDRLGSAQELYLAGVHVEQYRDPCVMPDAYWREALARDPACLPALTAMGMFCYRRARFDEARDHLARALSVLTRHNRNPRDGEPFYAMGLVQLALERPDDAYDSFFKASWSEGLSSRAMTRLACIDGCRGDWRSMGDHALIALAHAAENPLAGALAALAQRELGENGSFLRRLESILARDPLDRLAGWLQAAAAGSPMDGWYGGLQSSPSQTCLDVAFDLAAAGFPGDAASLLEGLCARLPGVDPMVYYTLGSLRHDAGRAAEAADAFRRAAAAGTGTCFPFRLEEFAVLRRVVALCPEDGMARYHLGCLLYDKGHHQEAASHWQESIRIDGSFPAAHRNLAVACYSHLGRREEALPLLRRALSLAAGDEQLLFETCHVMNRMGTAPAARLAFLEQNCRGVPRDDLLLEWVKALNQAGEYWRALEMLAGHEFVPCEGGEHAVAEQYMYAQHGIGRDRMRRSDFTGALESFRAAQSLPENLGAGLWHEALLVPHQLQEALCLEASGRGEEANAIFHHILGLSVDYFSNMHLPALPYFQARAMDRTGDAEGGRRRMEACLSQWSEAEKVRDPGYFKATPFFLSYGEEAPSARKAHYRYLTGMARMFLGDKAGAERDLGAGARLDPGNLYCQLEWRTLAGGEGWRR